MLNNASKFRDTAKNFVKMENYGMEKPSGTYCCNLKKSETDLEDDNILYSM